MFLIVFVETGLVFFPFLPGDLLFAAGVFLGRWRRVEHLGWLLIVFYVAAILGNTSNYWIARFFGTRIIDSGKVKALTPERMAKLDHFFARFGGLTIVITRFMPFFRTFAPFIAGTGHMNFAKFTLFNCIGGIAWVSLFVLVGYFFGGIPLVQDHFEVIVLGIVAVSVAPAIIGAIAAMSSRKKKRLTGARRSRPRSTPSLPRSWNCAVRMRWRKTPPPASTRPRCEGGPVTRRAGPMRRRSLKRRRGKRAYGW